METTVGRIRPPHAPQLHAVAALRRELAAADSCTHHRYLRDFHEAYRTYESMLSWRQLTAELNRADVLLVGDYHTLPSSQLFVAQLIEQLARESGRPVVLAVEMVYSSDQRALDAWLAREIDERELRRRIRYEASWGYDWAPFAAILYAGRTHCAAVYGVDCGPRGDMNKIGLRDQHAATKLAEIRAAHPGAIILAVFGEAHMAPQHLPAKVGALLPRERVLTVLQNVDELYWQAGAERSGRAAVRVQDGVVCVFNATPLEKYQSYRDYIERWQEGQPQPSTSRRRRSRGRGTAQKRGDIEHLYVVLCVSRMGSAR